MTEYLTVYDDYGALQIPKPAWLVELEKEERSTRTSENKWKYTIDDEVRV